MAMASAGYQRRVSEAWSEEMDFSKEIRRGENCPEITAASLMRARSRTEGRQSSLPLSHVATQGGFRSSRPWSSNQSTRSEAQGDTVLYRNDQTGE